MKFRSFAIAMLIAGSAGGPVLAQPGSGTAPSSTSASASATPVLPASAIELLVRIRLALAKGELLNDAFYSTANLRHFFGTGYRFTAVSDENGRKTIYFDDGGNMYIDEQGNPMTLARQRPCVRGGTIVFEPGGPGRKARGSMAVVTAGPAALSGVFSANLVREVFGVPSAISEGVPSAPPPHGLSYVTTPRSNEQGNRWLTYQDELAGHLQRVKFRTLGDATVIEIQLFEEQR